MANHAVLIGPPAAAESFSRSTTSSRPAARPAPRRCIRARITCPSARLSAPLAAPGIVFVGPKPGAIAAMGDKIDSKKAAAKARSRRCRFISA